MVEVQNIKVVSVQTYNGREGKKADLASMTLSGSIVLSAPPNSDRIDEGTVCPFVEDDIFGMV